MIISNLYTSNIDLGSPASQGSPWLFTPPTFPSNGGGVVACPGGIGRFDSSGAWICDPLPSPSPTGGGGLGTIFAGAGAGGGGSTSGSGGLMGAITNITGDPLKLLIALLIIFIASYLAGDYWWAADVLIVAAYYEEETTGGITNLIGRLNSWLSAK